MCQEDIGFQDASINPRVLYRAATAQKQNGLSIFRIFNGDEKTIPTFTADANTFSFCFLAAFGYIATFPKS